jgi:hypothetical protein
MIPFYIIKKPATEVRVEVGEGITSRKQGNRMMLASLRKTNFYSGAWAVTARVDSTRVTLTVGKGYVNTLEPVVGGVPISGVMPDGTLVNQPEIVGSVQGIATLCLKITPNESGKIDGDSVTPKLGTDKSLTVELVSGSPVRGVSGDSWWQPLAVFDQNGLVAQIAYFDYFYQAYKPLGAKKWRHRMTVG